MDKETRDAFDKVFEKIDSVIKMILGDGEKVGVVTRLDRLEQKSTFKSTLAWIIFTAIITASATMVVAALQ